jgi:catalase
MSVDQSSSPQGVAPPLGPVGALFRLALIGLVLAGIAVALVFLRGWLTPRALTPAKFVDGFEEVFGVHPGFRRNHAKGLGASGFFESNGNGVRLSKASIFRPGRVSVLGRFSVPGGNPYVADTPQLVHAMALEFSLPNGELWRTAMVNLPVFVVRTPEGFYEQLISSKPDPKTGKPDPAKQNAFLAHHPETVAALKIVQAQKPESGFADSTYHSLNAFHFVNEAGQSTAVRWIFTPDNPPSVTNPAPHTDKNYLFDDLSELVRHQPLRWHLVIIVGQAGDPTNDATLPWPASRDQVDVGTLTIDHLESEATSPATDINFDPLILPVGILPSDDPLLSPRSAVYSQSFTRREGETKEPSAVTPAEVEGQQGAAK